jgi:hypothetical protein
MNGPFSNCHRRPIQPSCMVAVVVIRVIIIVLRVVVVERGHSHGGRVERWGRQKQAPNDKKKQLVLK